MRIPYDIFLRAFQAPFPPLALKGLLQRYFSNFHILEIDDSSFDIELFARMAGCEIKYLPDVVAYLPATVELNSLAINSDCAAMEATWKGITFLVFKIRVNHYPHYFVLSEHVFAGEQLVLEVCRFSNSSEQSIRVFSNGSYSRDEEMFEQVDRAFLSDIVLTEEQKQVIDRMILPFFEEKEKFDRYRIPWKRGILLYGPPGNGKTSVIRALIKLLRRPTLVIKSFQCEDEPESQCIADAFKEARAASPCLVILEDIDSKVSKKNLSVLLNELDGLASNAGIMTIATTNHLEKLDSALSNRPSRFDRKIHFDNPSGQQREVYIESRVAYWVVEYKPNSATVKGLVNKTKGFSMALMQEVLSSSILRALNDPSLEVNCALEEEAENLKRQIGGMSLR